MSWELHEDPVKLVGCSDWAKAARIGVSMRASGEELADEQWQANSGPLSTREVAGKLHDNSGKLVVRSVGAKMD